MKTKLEGVVLSKRPFDSHHIMATICLRNGKKVNVAFYGGRGGGKKNKPSVIELGYVLSIEVSRSQKNTEVYTAKEWKKVWGHEFIRKNHKAFYLLCFFLETINQVLTEENLSEASKYNDAHDEGYFRVLSNSIFYLERASESAVGDYSLYLVNFLAKLLHELGIFPEIDRCLFSERALNPNEQVALVFESGGFAILETIKGQDIDIDYKRIKTASMLLSLLKEVRSQQTKELELKKVEESATKMLYDYFCYQTGIASSYIKSAPMVFQMS
ncbi:MAG: hypothetical protein ACPGJV_12660 [Bacteriovoracaceae bacterium]